MEENKSHFDTIILDVMMPRLDGLKTYEIIRDKLNSTRILFSSGYADNSKISKLRQPGRVDFIQKPFTGDALLNSIRNIKVDN